MTVDLSKAKAGDVAHFRCGGKAEILAINPTHASGSIRDISFKSDGCNEAQDDWSFFSTGYISATDWPEPFDIIKIEPKPFDWSECRNGMAFKVGKVYDGSWHFVGLDPITKFPVLTNANQGYLEYDHECYPIERIESEDLPEVKNV